MTGYHDRPRPGQARDFPEGRPPGVCVVGHTGGKSRQFRWGRSLRTICRRVLAGLVLIPVGLASSAEEIPSLAEALKSRRDLWGEWAIRQPDELRYDFLASRLPPLRYVHAAFRHYPIVLSAPCRVRHARLISNGSAINARAGAFGWREIGFPVTFRVGQDGEIFGQDLTRLEGPRYAEGYLPIVQLRYRQRDVVYAEEVFASVEPALGEAAAVFVCFTIAEGKIGVISVDFALDQPLIFSQGVLHDQAKKTLAWLDGHWQWDEPQRRAWTRLSADERAALVIFTVPSQVTRPQWDYEQHRRRCVEEWKALLGRGGRVETPEALVNNAWRALVIGTFMLCRGNRLCYSAGNVYERQYEAECGDAVRALALWGFQDEARQMIVPLLDYKQEGLGSHDAAFKLQMLAHYYWLTRDAAFVREQRQRLVREVEWIVRSREQETGLLPRENYCGDIHTQVYSLNSNANAWRGLRDMAAVVGHLGEEDTARHLRAVADEFRQAILLAVEKSERRDVTPPFIPVALFGEESPYDVLTDSRLGSYWCLMAPYVLGSGIFGETGERAGWILDYLHQHGGVFMGMIRFHQHSGLFANENALDDLYGLRYVLALLRWDQVDRALISFYGKLAHGLTRDTFIGAEGTGLVPLDAYGRPMYLPPNAASNAHFLWTLRYMLVQDWDCDDDGRPDTLRLLFATPRHWLEDGRSLQLERMPTAFGELSLRVQSRLSRGEVLVEAVLPAEQPKQTLLRLRLPKGWRPLGASTGSKSVPLAEDGTVDLSLLPSPLTVRLAVTRCQ